MPHHAPPGRRPDDAAQRAALLCQLRHPVAVQEAVDQGRVLPSTDVSLAMDALRIRGLTPWVPDDPALGSVLVVRGTPPQRPGVAIVGARASDPYGLAVARATATDAVGLGRPVISGGAEGCDAAAHEAAIEAGGQTVVVLGSGHDRLYPACHRTLFAKVVDSGGALVSAYWPETPPAKHRFLARNRVIAALADVVVIARARRRSGSLSAARAAKELGRTVLAVPGQVGEALAEGCNALLDGAARPMLGRGSLALAMGLGQQDQWPTHHRGAGPPWCSTLGGASMDVSSAEARWICAHLREACEARLDDMMSASGFDVAEMMGALLELELTGAIRRLPGERFALML